MQISLIFDSELGGPSEKLPCLQATNGQAEDRDPIKAHPGASQGTLVAEGALLPPLQSCGWSAITLERVAMPWHSSATEGSPGASACFSEASTELGREMSPRMSGIDGYPSWPVRV